MYNANNPVASLEVEAFGFERGRSVLRSVKQERANAQYLLSSDTVNNFQRWRRGPVLSSKDIKHHLDGGGVGITTTPTQSLG